MSMWVTDAWIPKEREAELLAQLAAAQAERDSLKDAFDIMRTTADRRAAQRDLVEAQLEQQRTQTQAARTAIAKVRDWLKFWENGEWTRLLDTALAQLGKESPHDIPDRRSANPIHENDHSAVRKEVGSDGAERGPGA